MNTKKTTPTQSRAKGLRLAGNPVLTTRVKQLDTERWPRAARTLHARIRKARRVALRQLVHDSRYARWTVRCLVKAHIVRASQPLAKAA